MSKREVVEADRYREQFGWQVFCAECNQRFESRRGDAAYCSQLCRTRAHRKKFEMQKRVKQARQAVEALLEFMPRYYSDDSVVWKEAQALEKRIKNALAAVEMR